MNQRVRKVTEGVVLLQRFQRMPAVLPELSRVIPSTPALEVEHRQRVVGAFGVAVDHWMPATTVRAEQQRIGGERDFFVSVHAPSCHVVLTTKVTPLDVW